MASLVAKNLLSLEQTGGFYKYTNRRNFHSQLLKVQTETATHLVSFSNLEFFTKVLQIIALPIAEQITSIMQKLLIWALFCLVVAEHKSLADFEFKESKVYQDVVTEEWELWKAAHGKPF